MDYRTNNMIVTASGQNLTAAWDVERSPDGVDWTNIAALNFTVEASTPVDKLITMVDEQSGAVAVRDRVVQELAVAAAAYYNERPIVLP